MEPVQALFGSLKPPLGYRRDVQPRECFKSKADCQDCVRTIFVGQFLFFHKASDRRMKASKSPAANASAKVNTCPLVLIEWEDSAQPIPSWSYLASFSAPGTIRCASVGWMIRDDDHMKALAPNMGAIDDENSVQVSGIIQIPTRCVLHITPIAEA